jgi:hypothetical protein
VTRARRGRFASAALATVLLTAGCLDFDEQELVVAYDGKRDQLDAQVVYRGLYSGVDLRTNWFRPPSEGEEEDVEGTERQLEQLRSGRPLFALFHAAYAADLVRMRESDDWLEAALADLITIDLGAPFRDADGRLCAWQHVTVRDVHHAFELIDTAFREKPDSSYSVEKFRAALGCTSRVSGVLWQAAIEKKARWFEEVGGELLWHVPASEGDAAVVAERIAKASTPEEYFELLLLLTHRDHVSSVPREDVHRAPEYVSGSDPYCVLLRAIGATTRRRAGGVDVVLWDPKREPRTMRIPAKKRDRKHWDLVPYLEKRKFEVRTDVTAETLRRDFDERRAR